MTVLRARVFVRLARLSPLLPPIRGKARAFLWLYDRLDLEPLHIGVEATLRRPTRFRARLDLSSWIERIAFLTGEYEAGTSSFLFDLHRRSGGRGYLLDIGANVGMISIPVAILLDAASGCIPEGRPRVVSIEAVAANVRALRRNLELSGAAHLVDVQEIGLGEVEKIVEVQIAGGIAAGEGTGTAHVIAPESRSRSLRVPLRLTTLDALFGAGVLLTGCRVIKIDTDGYDLKILEGGREFLARERPLVYGEFSAHCMAWHGQDLEDVVRFAQGLDYVTLRRVDATAWRFTSELRSRPFVQDLLLAPQELAADLEAGV